MAKNRIRRLPGSGRARGSFLSEEARNRMVQNIVDQREDAAQTALKIMFCVLNREYGFGLERLSKIGKIFNEEVHQYYDDRELEDKHVNDYLARIGFLIVDGHVYTTTQNGEICRGEVAAEAIESELAKDRTKVNAEIIARGR